MTQKGAWSLGLGLVACLAIACTSSDTKTDTATPRVLDTIAVKSRLQTPLPAGRAEAFFKLDTGRDQMGQSRKEAGLVVVVRVEADEYRQTIASCIEPGLGSALGAGTERELETALCDGEYRLISEPGVVTVVRLGQPTGGAEKEIARFELPNGIRAVSPASR